MQNIVNQLEQAVYNHQQWHGSLIRTLVCRLPSDQHDIAPEAHKECRFGQWYYNYSDKNLREHPGFAALGDEHQRMHQIAAHLLVAANAGNPISPHEYDNFANSIERMKLEIFTLQREIEGLLYNRDSLTGTVNRIEMLPLLREQQELIKRQVIQFSCLVMVDLDNFKKVNDVYGHPAGDKVLVATARCIIDHLRPYDKVFRYGGEEFLICIQQAELKFGYEMAERLRTELAAMAIDIEGQEALHVTASFGLTLLDPNLPVEESIDHADKALYAAKSAGRNNTKIWGAAGLQDKL